MNVRKVHEPKYFRSDFGVFVLYMEDYFSESGICKTGAKKYYC